MVTTTCTALVDLYKSGLSCPKIATISGLSASAVRKTLSKAGITIRQEWHHTVDQLRVVADYKAGLCGRELAVRYHASPKWVYRLLIRHGIKRRNPGSRKHPVNIEFFNCWSASMAYWLGVLCADGGMSLNMLSLTRKAGDKYHLVQFRDALGSDYEPKPFRRGENCFAPNSVGWRVTINSCDLVRSLRSNRFDDFKRGDPALVSAIPSAQFSHWLRGMTDGDGTVSILRRRNKHRPPTNYANWRLFSPSAEILEAVSARLMAMLGLTKFGVSNNNGIFKIGATWRKAHAVLDFIYRNCGRDVLQRKYTNYETINNFRHAA